MKFFGGYSNSGIAGHRVSGDDRGRLEKIVRKRMGLTMLQPKFLVTAGALAMVALIASGTGSAKAAEYYFGNSTTVPTGCATNQVDSDEGYVCGSSLTFMDGSTTLTATAYSANSATPFDSSNSAYLTWKGVTIPVANGNVESGLGENDDGPNSLTDNTNGCTDAPGGNSPTSTPCEAGVNTSVLVTSTTALTDVLIGSVQGPEQFLVYTATSIGGLLTSLTGTTPIGLGSSVCTTPPPDGSGADECWLTDLPTGTVEVGLWDLAANPTTDQSDTLITAVSLVPAPPIGQGLPVVLALGGLLFGFRLWERNKARRSLDAAAA